MNYTDELGLKLPELDEAFDLENHWNYNTQKIDAFAATTNTAVGTLESGLASAQSQIAALQGGVHLKGSVNYYADLPADPNDGDAYTVLYFGTSGQEPAGIEYAWVDSSQSWIPIGVDPAAFAKPADITAAIAALDVTETGGTGQYISAISETNGKISATPITFDTALSSSSTNNNAPTSKTVFDDQQRQEGEIGIVANAGAKNLLPDKHAVGNAVETNGFRFTLQSDGGIKIESIGTHSANGDYYIQGNWGNTVTVLDLSDDTYAATISCETTVSGISLRIFGANNTAIVNNIYLNNETNFTGEVKFIFITVISTAVIPTGGIIVYPMIRPASITDSTFQPYALPNPTLTPAVIKAVDEGAKNRLFFNEIGISASNHGTSLTTNAITYTVNSDGTISVSGTASAGAWVYLYNSADLVNAIDLFDGNHIITLNRGSTDISLFYSVDGASSVLLSDGDTLPASNGSAARIGMQVNKNVAISGTATVCPMICTAADWAVSQKFVPYCPTNRELYEMILALQSGVASTQSVQPALMSAAKAETQEQREEETDA